MVAPTRSTASAENPDPAKNYLVARSLTSGSVSRPFPGALVELFPGTDVCCTQRIAEHRVRDVRDELKLGDRGHWSKFCHRGNKIRLSRKALIKEARE